MPNAKKATANVSFKSEAVHIPLSIYPNFGDYEKLSILVGAYWFYGFA